MAILAEEFVIAGHAVKVVTVTEGHDTQCFGYEIYRSPKLLSFLRLLRWCDVCLSASVSLRALAPMLVAQRPVVLSHHCVYDSSFVSCLKRMVARAGTNICCSYAVQSKIPGKSTVIPNPYRSELFKKYDDVVRDLDIVFVGRLVSDKGVVDLIDALQVLAVANFRPRLSIVGDGPEGAHIGERVERFGLGEQVTFTGPKSGIELARFVGRHRLMAVPSRWAEPFGIVALEGIGCGCVVVGTQLGGLPEAIGPCGITVPNGDSTAMAEAIRSMLEDEGRRSQYRSCSAAHLASHSRSVIAGRYLEVMRSLERREVPYQCAQMSKPR